MNAPAHSFSSSGETRLNKTRVMVVDDSLTVRTVIARSLEAQHDMDVVSKLGSAELALAQLEESAPDVVVLDLEMPGIGGISALPQFLASSHKTKILVVSSLTQRGASATLDALSLGAADTLPKPASGEFAEDFCITLVDKVRALGSSTKRIEAQRMSIKSLLPEEGNVDLPSVVAIGSSTGGIHALNLFFSELPQALDAPILITQHLPNAFVPVFANQIGTVSKRPSVVAQSGMRIAPGHVYIAPGDGHLTVKRQGDNVFAEIIYTPMPSGCTPSVDPMLESLARSIQGRAIAVILSGMGRDGAIGAEHLFKAGGTIYAQDEATSAVWGMPRAVVEGGFASVVAPPEQLAQRISSKLAKVSWN